MRQALWRPFPTFPISCYVWFLTQHFRIKFLPIIILNKEQEISLQRTNFFTPHCWGLLVFLRSLPTIHSFHQSLEQMHWFEAIFEMFCSAVFEAIEVKGRSMLNFEAVTLKFCNKFWKLGCQPRKSNYLHCPKLVYSYHQKRYIQTADLAVI